MSTRLARIFILLAIVASSASLPGQEKPTREPTLAEAKADFEKADKELNAAWTLAQSKLTPTEFAALRDDQRAWVVFRDRQAESDAPAAGAARGADYFSTAAALSRSRAEWLRGLARAESLEALTGRWSDSYGGSLRLVEKDGQLFFSLDVVRGPTSHTGELSGIAAWNQPVGWFSDKGRDKSRNDETNLAFRWKNRRLELTGANTQPYHGARAYFDGDYVRVGALNAKEQAEVLKVARSGGEP